MSRPADPKARSALVGAARAEFARRGVKGARIGDITAACGLSKGAFYLHFPSKEALFGSLVEAFVKELERVSHKRLTCLEHFRAEHGQPGPADVATRSERYQRFLRMEAESDLEMLELMWASREVVTALIVGSQGTTFESVMWDVVDREVDRISQEFRHLQVHQEETPDVDPGLYGAFIVGTYLLLARQMGRLSRKPDLSAWATGIQRLMHEGTSPREPLPTPRALPTPPQAPPVAARTPSPSTPSTRRRHARAANPHRPPRKRP